MKNVTLDFSRPGKTTDNASNDYFNGKFRVECLNQHGFMSLYDAVGEICSVTLAFYTWRQVIVNWDSFALDEQSAKLV